MKFLGLIFVCFFYIGCAPSNNQQYFKPQAITPAELNVKYFNIQLSETTIDDKYILMNGVFSIKLPTIIYSNKIIENETIVVVVDSLECLYESDGQDFIKRNECPDLIEINSFILIKNIKNKDIFFKLGVLDF